MENIVVRQSVIIKCSLEASALLGNYEFYYACGLLCRLAGKQPAQDLRPLELYAFIEPLLQDYAPQNGQETYLLHMLRAYKAGDEYDSGMQQLFRMGLDEKNMWVQIT